MWASWALLLGLGLVVDPAAAQPRVHVIDATQASASFWIRPIWLKRIEGTFPVLEGVVEGSGENGAMTVDVRIDTRALQMGRASHVSWAQSVEFFDVARHPWIRFRSEPVLPQQLLAGGEVAGELTLRGVTRAVRFELQPASCTRPGFDCAVRATGELSRSDFGMDAKKHALSDTVHLDFSVRLLEAAAADTGAAP